MSLAFDEMELATPHGARHVLVVTPTEHLRVGAVRLAELREGRELGHIDARLLAEAQARAERVHICVFRSRDDAGLGSWAFADELADEHVEELCALLLRDQMLLFRELLASGYALFVHTELGPREVTALRRAVDVHLEELRRRSVFDEQERQRVENDRWILRHLVFHFEIGFSRLVESVLPDKIELIERRANLRRPR